MLEANQSHTGDEQGKNYAKDNQVRQQISLVTLIPVKIYEPLDIFRLEYIHVLCLGKCFDKFDLKIYRSVLSMSKEEKVDVVLNR